MRFPFDVIASADCDVVGFGTNAVDYLIRVPEYPAYNSKIEFTSFAKTAGGEAASTMTGLRRLGLITAYAGRFGSDDEGRLGLRSLEQEGVDVRFAEVVDGASTQIAFIVIDDKTGERTIMWQRDAKLAYGSSDPPFAIATLGRVLHITPHDTQACIKLARAARETGVIVSIDVDRTFPDIETLLPLLDVCIASSDFPAQVLGINERATALREIKARFGCPVIGLTLGDEGSVFLCNETVIETRAFAVPGGCVDTTGAGDAFRAGFLYGMLTGASVEDSARTANAVAALKCRSAGARAGLPSEAELAALLADGP